MDILKDHEPCYVSHYQDGRGDQEFRETDTHGQK